MDDLFGSNNNDNREQNISDNNSGYISNNGYDNNNYSSNNGYGNNSGYGNSNNNGYYGGGDNYRRDAYGYYNDNSYGGGNMYPPQQPEPKPEKKGVGFAVTAFIIAIVNLLICKSIISIITVPLCLVFAIISLAGKRKGKAFAIISIVLSVVSAVIFGFYIYIGVKIMPDMMYFMENSETIIEDFEEDGTLPERFEKYREPRFDKYWEKSGYKDFDSFFSDFIRSYKSGYSYGYNFGSGGYGSGSGEYSFSYSSGGNADL